MGLRQQSNRQGRFWLWVTVIFALLLPQRCCHADTYTLKNGMEVSGTLIKLSNIGTDVFASGGAGGVDVKPIYMLDDELRRTYFSTYQKQSAREDVENPQKISLKQPVARRGDIVGAVGPYFRSPTTFDDYGRRTVYLATPKGQMPVIQGITEVSPLYLKVQGLQADRSVVWDTRIATSSIPRDTLSRILRKHLSEKKVDDRLSIVRLYLQAERYGDAEAELESAIADFPQLKDLSKQLREIQQLRARQRLNEIKLRKAAGQHDLANTFLQNFPEKDVAGELLLEVREQVNEYAKLRANADQAFALFDLQMDEMPEGARKDKLLEFREELAIDLGFDTMPRLLSFLRLADDDDLTSEQKLSLAISRWVLATDGTDNLAVAFSLLRTRTMVREYLVTENQSERQQILVSLRSEEAASPKYVAKLLDAMRPIRDVMLENEAANTDATKSDSASNDTDAGAPSSDDADAKRLTGLYEFNVPGLREGESTRYIVQVPPEYHSYKRYPAIVTLHGARSNPERQLDWWSGNYNAKLGMRTGQAARHGYIVIAPAWTVQPNQRECQYSAGEHAAVLSSLRDAMRRFSIDSDRVFLSGHSLGGDAAWDIGLAHPDLWAGVIPIGATAVYKDKDAPKYVTHYWENARQVPMMFIAGALDVARISANARELTRYLTKQGFDSLVVEYRGRGHESFQDEIHRIFTWMELHERTFFPREFDVVTLRPWDNFFWWLEFSGMPKKSTVLPTEWPRTARAMKISASAREKQSLVIKAGVSNLTLWLSPDLVDLDQGIKVNWRGNKKTHEIKPSLEVMLEDVRLRADRQHPFWAKIELGTGRRR